MDWGMQNRLSNIIKPATGRTVMPYVAARITTGLTADCTELDIEEGTGNLLQIRPAIGGNIMATIKSPSHRPQLATVRPRSMKPAAPDETRKGAVIRESVPAELLRSRVRRLRFEPAAEDSPLDLGYDRLVGCRERQMKSIGEVGPKE